MFGISWKKIGNLYFRSQLQDPDLKMFGKSWKQLEIYECLKNFKKWNPPEKSSKTLENRVWKELNVPTGLKTETLVHYDLTILEI